MKKWKLYFFLIVCFFIVKEFTAQSIFIHKVDGSTYEYNLSEIDSITFKTYDQDSISDLRAYYPFNGNANDESGNNNHGIVHGATLTEDRNGNPNSAYSFDGTNDYIDIGNNFSLKPNLPITIATWIYLYDEAYFEPIFYNNFVENHYYGIVFNIVSGNRLNISYGDGGPISPGSRTTKRGTKNLNFNQWHHVAAVINDSTHMHLYVDGEYDQSVFTSTNAEELKYSSSSGVIGLGDPNSEFSELYYFNGKVDNLYLFAKALTEQEIYNLYIEQY